MNEGYFILAPTSAAQTHVAVKSTPTAFAAFELFRHNRSTGRGRRGGRDGDKGRFFAGGRQVIRGLAAGAPAAFERAENPFFRAAHMGESLLKRETTERSLTRPHHLLQLGSRTRISPAKK